MVGMPYFLLGTVGYLVYRRLRNADPGAPPQDQVQSLSREENRMS